MFSIELCYSIEHRSISFFSDFPSGTILSHNTALSHNVTLYDCVYQKIRIFRYLSFIRITRSHQRIFLLLKKNTDI